MEQEWIEVEAMIEAPIDQVWAKWTQSEHITNWNFAHESWCCPAATIDLREEGNFLMRMEAVDGSAGFDFHGIYDTIEEQEFLAITLGDGRKWEVEFADLGQSTHVTERFHPESENSLEMQKAGWQAILNQFKTYCEE
ncbi:MAG: SRPBCC domain-containing protein [Flavobacteriales bacterium]